jgi:hypothetical protein
MPKEEGHDDSPNTSPDEERQRGSSRERLTSPAEVEDPNDNNMEKQPNQSDRPDFDSKQPPSQPEAEKQEITRPGTPPSNALFHGLRLDGILTSPGPPLGITHPAAFEQLEMGTFSQPPDPAQDPSPEDDNDEEQYFAVPGGPGVLTSRDNMQDGNDPNAFFHPATKEPQMILWLPRDELGLCEAEIEGNLRFGVESTSRYAILDHRVSCENHI